MEVPKPRPTMAYSPLPRLMNKPSPLAIFTPSLVDHEILQTLFVGESRTRLLNDLVDRATSAATIRNNLASMRGRNVAATV